MDRTKTKGISFAPQYEREYNYVMEIKNASKYICELIKKDLDFKKNKTINNDSHNMWEHLFIVLIKWFQMGVISHLAECDFTAFARCATLLAYDFIF